MKRLFAVLVMILFVTHAEATWYEKPIQCGDTREIYRTLIDPHNVEPLFIATGVIIDSRGNETIALTILYINQDTSEYLILEASGAPGEICIISIGSGVDFSQDKDFIRQALTGDFKS
jgi:hypothetical protein